MIANGFYNFLSPSSTSHLAPSVTPNPPPLVPNPPTPPTAFAQLLQDADLPPPGPDYYAARRALWTAPTLPPKSPTSSSVKLDVLLNQPGALESDQIWAAGLSKIWRGLVGGGRLKNLLPLHTVVKILYAGWRKDGTWPENTAIADDDNFFGTSAADPQAQLSMISPGISQGTLSDISSLSRENSVGLQSSTSAG